MISDLRKETAIIWGRCPECGLPDDKTHVCEERAAAMRANMQMRWKGADTIDALKTPTDERNGGER